MLKLLDYYLKQMKKIIQALVMMKMMIKIVKITDASDKKKYIFIYFFLI